MAAMLNALKSAFGELEQAMHAMSAAMYAKGQQPGGEPGPQAGAGQAPPQPGKKDGDDLNALKSAFGELEQAAHAMAAAQASRSQGGGPGPQGGPTPPTAGKKDGDDVVDAEFEVK